MTRLLEGFVKIVFENGVKKLSMVNPSVNDYLDGRMNASDLEKRELIDFAFSIQQKKRLLNDGEFETFVETALKSHTIEKYLFDSEKQKISLITFFACKEVEKAVIT